MKLNRIEKIYSKIGDIIFEYRRREEISQKEIGKMVGLSRVSIANIENGRQRILLHDAIEIFKILNIPLKDIL